MDNEKNYRLKWMAQRVLTLVIGLVILLLMFALFIAVLGAPPRGLLEMAVILFVSFYTGNVVAKRLIKIKETEPVELPQDEEDAMKEAYKKLTGNKDR